MPTDYDYADSEAFDRLMEVQGACAYFATDNDGFVFATPRAITQKIGLDIGAFNGPTRDELSVKKSIEILESLGCLRLYRQTAEKKPDGSIRYHGRIERLTDIPFSEELYLEYEKVLITSEQLERAEARIAELEKKLSALNAKQFNDECSGIISPLSSSPYS